MTWLTPWLGAIAAMIAVPLLLILYFLKLKRRELAVSSTLLWRKSVEDLQANAPFQRLRKNLLLFIQLLVLALILLALAQPVGGTIDIEGDRFIVMIDRSASMAAPTEPDSTTRRIDAAKDRALELIDRIDTNDNARVMIVAFGGVAEVIAPFTSDLDEARNAIERLEPGEGPTRIEDAIALVAPHIRPTVQGDAEPIPGATLHVFSDGRITDTADVRLHPDARVNYNPLRTNPDTPAPTNVGITAMRAERPFDNPNRADIFVGLSNAGPERSTVDVELIVNGNTIDIREVSVPPAPESTSNTPAPLGTTGIVFSLDRDRSAVVRAVITTPDAVPADNEATIVLPPAQRLRVAYVAGARSPFLDLLLPGLDFAELRRFTPAEFDAASADELAAFDLTILVGWAPTVAPPARETDTGQQSTGLTLADDPGLPPGRYLVFDAVPALAGLTTTNANGAAVEGGGGNVTSARQEHPALRFVPIDELRVAEQRLFQAAGAARVLAETQAATLIAEVAHADVNALIVGFDPTESSWALDQALVVFTASAVRHVAQGGAGPDNDIDTQSLRTGEVLSERLPSSATNVRLDGPGLNNTELQRSPDNRVSYGPIERVGLYRLTWDGPPGPRDTVNNGRATRLIPVSLLSETETDTRVATSLRFATSDVAASAAASDADQDREPWWPYLVLAALTLIIVEWWIYNRRTYL